MTVQQTTVRWMDEQFRPQYHYTAEKNMINDPNGLIYLDGEWHLFHQYNQHEVVHWGHAVSTDLLHWQHMEPAIFPDELGQIYSGTAVVDHENTSGLRVGEGPVVVAFFTYADHHDGTQSQGLAYSNDHASTWTMHPANPIIPNPGQKDFRDPKVFWHEESQRWILIVTGGDHLEFFRSPDLLHWTFEFAWGHHDGSHAGVWECPDLFELAIDGTDDTRWVLSVSVDRGAPGSGSGMQYFVGRFDGHSFINDNLPQTVLWQNWGQDYYAGITWENVPATDGRRIMIAWADNWLYRFDVPTTPFNGQLTVPRELRLVAEVEGLRLVPQPVRELERLRQDTQTWGPRTIESSSQSVLDVGDTYEVLATFDVASSTASEFGVEVRVGPDQSTRIGYHADRQAVFIDRSQAGIIPTALFTSRHEAPVVLTSPELTIHVLVDRSSVELFVNGTQLTDLILPDVTSGGFRPYAAGGAASLTSLTLHTLAGVWEDRPCRFTPVSGAWAQTSHDIRGSHETLGLALVEAVTPIDCTLTVLGTRHENPTKVLGEQAAGIAFTDPDVASGVAVLLDLQQQKLVARDLATGENLAETEARCRTNQPYRLSITHVAGLLEARIEGVAQLRLDLPNLPDWTAVAVENAEAAFEIAGEA